MIDTYEKCSCGKRDRVKCVQESGLEGGKMCLKPVDLPEMYVYSERMQTFLPKDMEEDK